MIPRIGTEDYPFIDLTPHVNISELNDMLPSIYWGIAKSTPRPAVVTHTLDHQYSRANAERFVESNPRYQPEYHNLLDGGASFKREAVIYAGLAYGHYSGSQLIPITELKPGFGFTQVHNPQAVAVGRDYDNFPDLLSWVQRLPFEKIGRITLFINPTGVNTPIHRDGDYPQPHKHELMWFNIWGKKLFLVDCSSIIPRKIYAKHNDRALFFDDMNWHGTEAVFGSSISLRVDGVFKQELRDKIGISHLDNYVTEGIRV